MPSPWPFAMLFALAPGATETQAQAQAVAPLRNVRASEAREIRSENGAFMIVHKAQEKARAAGPEVRLGAHVRIGGLFRPLERQKVTAR